MAKHPPVRRIAALILVAVFIVIAIYMVATGRWLSFR